LFDSAAIRATMRRVTVRLDAEMERLFTEKRMAAAMVKVTGVDGTLETARVDHAHGDFENPLSDADLDRKYRGLAAAVLDSGAAEQLLEKIRNLEQLTRAAELGELAAGPRAMH
jgi:2-methylcitrate dehydratase PrpD